MRTLLLLVTYLLVVTPIGLVCRVVFDPLQRRWRPDAHSYWVFSAQDGGWPPGPRPGATTGGSTAWPPRN
jgi:hypothetical protein